MSSDGFKTCATVRFATKARLLPTSWCPDKDLVLVVTNLAGKDRLSLWPREGARKMWEVEPNIEVAEGTQIIDVAWSPDGLEIAIAHDPPAITIHSIQDGRQTSIISIILPTPNKQSRLTSIWWFREHRPEKRPDIPDIFKRLGDITGSAHSILRVQPLLDTVQDYNQPLSSSELFAFKGNPARLPSASTVPAFISTWPTLPLDLTAASFLSPSAVSIQQRPGEELDENDDSNVNSVLAVADDNGGIHPFLDGSFPLGVIDVGKECTITSLYKGDNTRYFFHPASLPNATSTTQLSPTELSIPFLRDRVARDVARSSTAARELAWYTFRVVKEMRAAWFGSDTQQGAREAGPKWLRALEQRQKKFGKDERHAILDLTALLTTGRAHASLADFLGSGEQMSERSLQKWEVSVTEALTKLRDYATQRVAPALQRLHILLQELLGWTQLPGYHECMFRPSDIMHCLQLAGRGIVCASWLTAAARKELARYKEFIAWLKYENAVIANTNTDNRKPRITFDMLEVNEYLMSGLAVSSIDKWFMGPVPSFQPADLGVPQAQDLASSVHIVRELLDKPDGVAWPPHSHHHDLSRLDRNLDSLIQELCTRCHLIFTEASKAAARSARISYGLGVRPDEVMVQETARPLFARERTVSATDKTNSFVQHLAMAMPHGDGQNLLMLVRLHHDKEVSAPVRSVSVAVLQCAVPLGAEGAMAPVEVLDAEFFDDNTLVIVYRPRQREHGPTSIATMSYTDLAYEDIGTVDSTYMREELVGKVQERVNDGQISSVSMRLIQSRALLGCREGTVTLAVNGRVGRRVACVLDDGGLALEIMDVESPEEEEEAEETEDA